MERMTSLLARVTGGGRSGVKTGKAEESEAAEPAAQQGTMKPPRFGSVSPEERLPQSKPEEELLDIPAFLRRQAN
jgi:cell division protein FtsZ